MSHMLPSTQSYPEIETSRPMSPMEEAMARIRGQVGHMHRLIGQVHEKAAPVLRPSPMTGQTSDGKADAPRVVPAPLVQELESMSDSLREALLSLEDLHQRIVL